MSSGGCRFERIPPWVPVPGGHAWLRRLDWPESLSEKAYRGGATTADVVIAGLVPMLADEGVHIMHRDVARPSSAFQHCKVRALSPTNSQAGASRALAFVFTMAAPRHTANAADRFHMVRAISCARRRKARPGIGRTTNSLAIYKIVFCCRCAWVSRATEQLTIPP